MKSWDITTASSPKDIAVLQQKNLGWKARWELQSGGVSMVSFTNQLSTAGHNVSGILDPTEKQTIDALNNNDIVIILGHGPNDNMDGSQTTAFAGIGLGGIGSHTSDDPLYKVEFGVVSPTASYGAVPASWVTANELEGKVHNRDLIVIVPGCNAGRTSRRSRLE